MMQPLTIEHMILEHGHRGMDRLARYLPNDYASQAAIALWSNRARVLITTGFYVNGHAETDGPPGAFFLGRALSWCGASVGFVCESQQLQLLNMLVEDLWQEKTHGTTVAPPELFEFPIADRHTSDALARQITSTWQPTAVIAIERCGRTESGHYRNIKGHDITQWTAQVDELVNYRPAVSVGIGDGGNEIGMGTLSRYLPEVGIADPVVSKVDYLVLGTVSNWGAYGILAYLGRAAQRNLLPTDIEEISSLDLLVLNGVVDGVTGNAETTIDGFSLQTDLDVLASLRVSMGLYHG